MCSIPFKPFLLHFSQWLRALSACLVLATLSISAVVAAELPQYGAAKHMGVATCANSTCHAVAPHALDATGAVSHVLQNEYPTWLLYDPHAKAYATLLSDESEQIAHKLGLQNAVTASVCLDCHADNVAPERQGEKFLLSDGVGCEACHGGAERWLSSHILSPYDADRNLQDGMYPTSPLKERAALCLSCHLGDEKKLVSHDMMGAGHPRLSFELDTFTIRQPEHFVVDADYVARKQAESPVRRLLLGVAVQAQAAAKNLNSELLEHPQGYPELVLYDCHSCHHPIDDLRWQQRPSTTGLKPGAIRLNDASFILLSALVAPLDPILHQQLSAGIRQLHDASTRSVAELRAAAVVLLELSQQAYTTLSRIEPDEQLKRALVTSLMQYGVKGEYRDYIAAEQAVMGMDVLAYSLPLDADLLGLVNRAYRFTQDQDAYASAGFVDDLKAYLKARDSKP